MQKLLFEIGQPTVSLVNYHLGQPVSEPLVKRYAAALGEAGQSGDVSQVLWLAPHRWSAEAIGRRLTAAGRDAVLEPGIKTLARLSEAIVSFDPQAPTIVPGSTTRWLLSQSLAELQQAGKLSALESVAARTGLVDALELMLGELKSRGITPDRFTAWARHGNRSPRDRELAAVAMAYQDKLTRAGCADRFDLPRLAAESLARTPQSTRWQLVVIDGFTSFAYYERQLLIELFRRSAETHLSLATIDETDREELVSTARRTRQWLLDEYTVEQQTSKARPKTKVAALGQLQNGLFLPPDQSQPASDAVRQTVGHVQIATAADAYDETVNVARRVKQLLNAGTSPDDVVVVSPAIEAHHLRLEEVFETYGIPAYISVPATLDESPTVRAILNLLTVAADDWPFRELLAVLSSGLFGLFDGQLSEGPWRTLRGAAEWLVRHMEIASGRSALLGAIDRIASGASEALERDEKPTELQAAALATREAFEQFSQACQALPQSANPTAWVAICERLAANVGLALEPTLPSAWQSVREASAWIERVASAAGIDRPSWTLRTWITQLSDWSTRINLSPPQEIDGRVRVLPASVARFVSPQHLFVVGMGEQAFSSAESSGGLYSAERYDEMIAADSSGHKVAATPAHERAMQLFHGVVSSPAKSLTFSYAALDGSGQSTPPSPMLTEVCRTMGGLLDASLTATPRITPLPPPKELPCSLRDWRLLAVDEATKGDTKLLSNLAASEITSPTSHAVLDGLSLLHHRVRGDSFGPWEGLLSSPEVRQWFNERYGAEHQWSTSQLETYATCPYKFMMKNVLRIEPLSGAALEVDYSRRGSLLHRVFSALHERLEGIARDQPVSHIPAKQFQAELDAAVATARDELASYGLEGVLNELLAAEVAKWAQMYHEQHAEYDARSQSFDEPLRPAYFELRFGKPSRHADDDESPDSTDKPFVFDIGEGIQVVLGGRIDRVDMGHVNGTPVLHVIDYKSARSHQLKDEDMTTGLKLQPPLYALAAAELLSTPEQQVVPLKAGYWVLRDKGFADKNTHDLYQVEAQQVVPTEDWTELEQQIKQRLREIVHGVRGAEFPMVNSDDKCTGRCEYGHICRVAQTRSLGKAWPPIESSEGAAEEPTDA